MAEHEIELLKESLNLQPHPEGGAFIELWKGDRNVKLLGDTKLELPITNSEAPESSAGEMMIHWVGQCVALMVGQCWVIKVLSAVQELHRESDFRIHDGVRATGSSIYYLIVHPSFMSWHRHLSDEIFFWHAGGPLRINMIQKDGCLMSHTLGNVLLDPSCVYQVTVPHDTWYSAELVDMKPYCLCSAVVMPGFECQDSFAADRIKLTAEFPQHEEIISRLARPT